MCSKAKNPRLAIQWIYETETANLIDDLISPKSILGRSDFPYYNELDMMIAAAWRKLLKHDRFLRRRQSAFMIYDQFRSTGFHEEIQGLSGLFSIRLENDDIQDFDLRWEQALLSRSDPPADLILEGLYKSKWQDASQLQTVLSLYNQDSIRSGGKRDYHRLRMCVKLHIDQTLRNKNFRIQNKIRKQRQVIKSANLQCAIHRHANSQCRLLPIVPKIHLSTVLLVVL